ncbi:MAG: hypothetical protein ACLSUW_03330 [Akkermansia sp.]
MEVLPPQLPCTAELALGNRAFNYLRYKLSEMGSPYLDERGEGDIPDIAGDV